MGTSTTSAALSSRRLPALLVFRGWIEEGADPAVRVRVTRVDDLATGSADSFVTTSPAALHAALDEWLEALQTPDG